jgi:ATP synthase protein I
MENKEKKNSFEKAIKEKQHRKMKAQREGEKSIWFGLGMMGLVGWSVAIPTLLGVAIGLWLDRVTEGTYSWTLIGLGGGLIVGCLNAWFWVTKERKEMEEEEEQEHGE